MKVATIALTATAATAAMAQPHAHAHAHAHHHRHVHPVKRDVTVTSNLPGPTAYAYILDGKPISLDEVCHGLNNNELKFADGNAPFDICHTSTSTTSTAAPKTTTASTPSSSSTTTPAPTTTTVATTPVATSSSAESAASATGAAFFQKPSWSSSHAPAASSSAAASSASSSGSSGGSGLSGGQGVSSPFPDGTIDCGTFPSAYGAVSLDYLGLGGWSGLQGVTIVAELVTHIVTGVSGQSCSEGMMCSYACPPGYQKSQWPTSQGSTGQSVGGLQCKNGKLHLTNPNLSSSLCVQGVGGVQAQNSASGVVSICRTDYPGTESETIPVELQPGETEALTCPDAATYYTWKGQSTSAQYYLNPIGTPASKGCQWGSPGGDIGNYAPINFGVGAKDGKTWLSIFQNAPTTNTKYQGTVELKGNLSGSCKYSNGQYCGDSGCNAQGCTVSVISGEATFAISS